MSSRSMAAMEPSDWNELMLLRDQSHPTQQSHHLSYLSIASSSCQLSSEAYLGSPNTYTQSPDRPRGGHYGGHNFPPRTEICGEIHQQYVYHPYINTTPTCRAKPLPQSRNHILTPTAYSAINPTMPLPHRRSSLDTQGYSIGQGFPHLPNPVQLQHNPQPSATKCTSTF